MPRPEGGPSSAWTGHLVFETADEAPATPELAHGEDQFVGAFAQRQVQRVVLRVDDPEEARIAEVLRAAAAVENAAVQEHAHLVAVAEEQLLHLVAIGLDRPRRV